MGIDYIDFEQQKIIRNCKSVILSAGTHTLNDAQENGKYLCSQQQSGTLNGKILILQNGVNNAEVVYPLATPTEETIDLPIINLPQGTLTIDTDTDIKPSKINITGDIDNE